MPEIIPLEATPIGLDKLIPFLHSKPILGQILREMLLDRIVKSMPDMPLDNPSIEPQQAEFVQRQQKIQQFKQRNWGDQLEKYFLQRKRQLDQVVYSVIRTPDIGLTHELYFQVQGQEASFAELARQYSQGPEALTNGIIGPVKLSTLPAELARKLSTLRPGEISHPIRFQNTALFVKLERHLPAQFNVQTQQQLLDELFETWLLAQIEPQLEQYLSQNTETAQFKESCTDAAITLSIAA
jgi:parvulin-like peptidyl-prolyl isomerase